MKLIRSSYRLPLAAPIINVSFVACIKTSAFRCHPLKNLKKIIRIALENDWIKKDPFAYYRFKLKETYPEFLTMDEIKIILAKEFTIKRVEQVRDVFIFCSYTGLAFSDVKDLSPEHLLKDNKGELWIKIFLSFHSSVFSRKIRYTNRNLLETSYL